MKLSSHGCLSVLAAMFAACLTAAAHACPKADAWRMHSSEIADRAFILEGVHEVAAPGTPGTLAVWGPSAFVLAAGRGEHDLPTPVIAAGVMGRGRVVAFPHTGLLSAESLPTADTAGLITNCVRWAAGVTNDRPVVVGLFNSNLAETLNSHGFTARPVSKRDLTDDTLAELDVLCIVGNDLTNGHVKAIARFVERGRGLLAAQTAWAWKAPPGKSLSDNPLNVLFAPSGIAWTGAYAGKSRPTGFVTAGADQPMLHGEHALDAVIAAARSGDKPGENLRLASKTALHAVRSMPVDDALLRPRVDSLILEHAAELAPTAERPITSREPLRRLLLAASIERDRRLRADEVRPHPSAASFPGKVAGSSQRATRSLRIDPSVAGWHSTGLYAAPGEVVNVVIPHEHVPRGLRVRIGCHKDELWHLDTWKRVPQITREFPLDADRIEAASAFGGPIYLVVDERFEADPFEVTISNAVEAPMFVLGRTTPEDWRSSIRELPAPWAELVGRRIILSVPSSAVRNLDDPASLMEFWDAIATAQDDLATVANVDRNHRQDRFVADIQISAGYMHAGYPIMTHLDAVDDMTSVDKLRAGCWGLYHELGHNHQHGDWTFEGTVEVTCNLFTLYTLDKACGVPWGAGHGGLKNRDEKIGRHLAAGAPFDAWKSDPFLALHMYVQLIEGFGWETVRRVFAEYRTLARPERPANDDHKRDQWLVRYSRACGRDLGPFFQAWGVPTSDQARGSINHLPVWMPPGFPPE
ncbi:MAG: M60 family metallopeptidase [Phycisphaerales bacterium]